MLLVAGLTSCGVLDPVPVESGTTRLWSPPPRKASTATGADKAGAATPLSENADSAACSATSRFIGGLDLAICEADQRRLAYLQRSAAVVNGVANYNAAMWPLGAAAVYEKLRGAPNHNLLLPATLAAASYGFMTAGIPAREKIYVEAARQLGCVIVSAAPDLYRLGDVDPELAVPHQSPPALRPALNQLALQIAAYDRERADMLADLQPRRGTAAVTVKPSGNVFERWSQPAGGGRAAVKGDDKRNMVAAETRARLVHARAQLAAGQALLRRLEDGATATALRGRMALIDATVHKQLADQAPAPSSPASAAADFKSLTGALLTLQAAAEASAPAASAAPDPLETALPAAVFDGLDPNSAKAVRQFQKTQAAALRDRVQAVSDWLARHATGRQEVAQSLEQSGCTPRGEDAAQDATKLLLDISRKLSERAKTSNTAASGGSADPASGTPLPGAKATP